MVDLVQQVCRSRVQAYLVNSRNVSSIQDTELYNFGTAVVQECAVEATDGILNAAAGVTALSVSLERYLDERELYFGDFCRRQRCETSQKRLGESLSGCRHRPHIGRMGSCKV